MYSLKSLFLGFFIFLQINLLQAQQYSNFKKHLDSNEIKESTIDSFLLREVYLKNDSISFIYRSYARWLYRNKNLTKASLYAQKSFDKTSPLDSLNIQRNSYLLGYYEAEQKKYFSAINAYEISVSHKKDIRYTIRTYEQLAYLYNTTYQYDLSAQYWDLIISHHLINKNNQRLKEAYNYAADIYNILDDSLSLKKGRQYILKADSLATITMTTADEFYYIKLTAAQLYNKYESLDVQKAKKFLFQTKEYATKENDNNIISTSLILLGNLYNTTNQEKSIFYSKEALKFITNKDIESRRQAYRNLGYNHQVYNNYEEGFKNQYKALRFFLTNSDNERLVLDHKNIINSDDLSGLRYLLSEISESYLKRYINHNKEEDLIKSLEFFSLSDVVVDKIQSNNREFKSRLFWRELSSELYNKAIKASYLANDLEQAFYYMEKNKMLLLLQDQNAEQFKQSLEISDKIVEEQNRLEKEIITYESELSDEVNIHNRDLNEKILTNKLRLKTINDSLGIYQASNIDSKIITLKEFQSSLKEDELRISYHVSSDDGYGIYSNKDNGYVLFVTKDNAELIEIDELGALKSDVIALASSFQSPLYDKEAIDQQKRLSYSVYERLFPNEYIKKLLKDKKVVISTDDFLSFLPFEALQTSLEDNAYFIKECEISYALSHSFQNTLTEPIVDDPQLLAVAPVTFTDDVYAVLTYTNTANKEEMGRVSRSYDSIYTPLTYSKDEISGISDYYKGKVLLGKSATKIQFADALSTASIVHLSTHAGVDKTNEKPWIAFRDERLTGDELYLMKNNASLVFLSGCETNIGEIKKGEGVMSLARSFFSGGAQSIISTLWSIDDKSSSVIVKSFYKNLSKGKSKSASLREAKLAYLENSSLSEQSPYYWGAFVLIGNDASITVEDNTLMYVIALTLLIGIAVVFMLKRRRKK